MMMMMMMMIMMSGFVEHIINSPQTCYQSAKQAGLQILSKHRRREYRWGESCRWLELRPQNSSSPASDAAIDWVL